MISVSPQLSKLRSETMYIVFFHLKNSWCWWNVVKNTWCKHSMIATRSSYLYTRYLTISSTSVQYNRNMVLSIDHRTIGNGTVWNCDIIPIRVLPLFLRCCCRWTSFVYSLWHIFFHFSSSSSFAPSFFPSSFASPPPLPLLSSSFSFLFLVFLYYFPSV